MVEWIALIVSILSMIIVSFLTVWSTNKSIDNQNKQTYRPFLRIKSVGSLRSLKNIFCKGNLTLITKDENGNICKGKSCFFKLNLENIGNGPANRIMVFIPVDQVRNHPREFYNNILKNQEILPIDVKLLYDSLKKSSTYMIVFFEDIHGNLYSTKFEFNVNLNKKKLKVQYGQKETHDYQIEKKFKYPELKDNKEYENWIKQRKYIKEKDGIIL